MVVDDEIWDDPALFKAVIRGMVKRWDLLTLRQIAQGEPVGSVGIQYFTGLYEEIRGETQNSRLPTINNLRSNNPLPDA
jgi:hypothetical protein